MLGFVAIDTQQDLPCRGVQAPGAPATSRLLSGPRADPADHQKMAA